jgi:hypothetical protein
MVGEPHPEEAIEARELRSLRSAAEQGKLLPERQVLEREVGAGSERRAQGAQQSEYEGALASWLARRLPIVQSREGVLADDSSSGLPLLHAEPRGHHVSLLGAVRVLRVRFANHARIGRRDESRRRVAGDGHHAGEGR